MHCLHNLFKVSKLDCSNGSKSGNPVNCPVKCACQRIAPWCYVLIVRKALIQVVSDIKIPSCYINTEGPIPKRGETLLLCPLTIRVFRESQLRPHFWKCLLSYTCILSIFHFCTRVIVILTLLMLLMRFIKGHNRQTKSNV